MDPDRLHRAHQPRVAAGDSTRRHRQRVFLCWLLAACAAAQGCASQHFVTLRSEPHSPLATQLQLYARQGPQPSRRTVQFLRQHDLLTKARLNTRWAVTDVGRIHLRNPSPESCYALAELSFIAGRSNELQNREQAQSLYWDCIVHSYEYLFDPKYEVVRTPYDPQFRSTCDLYNGALEHWLRIAQQSGKLNVGGRIHVHTKQEVCDVSVVSLGSVWKAEDFERFEFASAYQVTGVENQHVTHGLGVPLIAVRHSGTASPEVERYYARGLSFPMTAFLRPSRPPQGESTPVLELHDPFEKPEIKVAGHQVPLESDITTPLAYFLSNSSLQRLDTYGLLLPDRLRKVSGLYMVQPYQRGKIPVVMIHGLWSSPMTWMEAFNDLQSYPEIRDHFQFWFYLYPTGQPFPETAAALRRDLEQIQKLFGTGTPDRELNQMVVVGHSMGGLIARSLAIDGPDATDSIRRVVTIASPFRGSEDSNDLTRWLARQFIRLPKDTMDATRKFLIPGPPGSTKQDDLQGLTSIDSLSPESPILQALLKRSPLQSVVFHNIIGVLGDKPDKSGGDGVVTYASAHLDEVASELVVPAGHLRVHQHPRTILELRRILDVHLRENGVNAGPAIELLKGTSPADGAESGAQSGPNSGPQVPAT